MITIIALGDQITEKLMKIISCISVTVLNEPCQLLMLIIRTVSRFNKVQQALQLNL